MKGTFLKGWFSSIFILTFCIFLVGVFCFYNERPATAVDRETYQNLKIFNEVLDIIEKNYVEEIDSQTLLQGAIKGMVRSLDPHSNYMTAQMFKDLQVDTKGQFGGLGIEITIQDDFITVVAPIEDTPAFGAGIKAGDQLIKIDGEFVKGISIMDAVHKLRGPKGTDVTVTIIRKGLDKPKDFTIKRAIIKIESVKYKTYEDNIGYIRISSFQEPTVDELIKVLKKNNNATNPLKGIILDLRNNPGGLLDQAVKVSDVFLESGLILSTKGRDKNSDTTYTACNDGIEPACPIIILINGGSASASEIVSGALHDNAKAVLLGTKTFGKGSMQVVIPLEDGSALKMTTARYYTPSGESIQAKGITPDIVVEYIKPSDGNNVNQISEKDLKGHIENEEAITKRQEESKDVIDDNQLKNALDLLKSWDIMVKMSKNIQETLAAQ